MKKQLPVSCPACGHELRVARMHCHACDTAIEGDFALPVILRMSREEQRFMLQFIRHSGSLKKMARERNLSYPTVRHMLNELIDKLNQLESPQEPPHSRSSETPKNESL